MKYKTKKNILIFSIYTLLQFLLFTAIAMILYPGGTKSDHNTTGYDFLNNFFSDLGRTLTFNGEEKKASFYLFTSALISTGISTIAFFLLFPTLFKIKQISYKFSYGAAAGGVITGFAYIGIALTPWDILLQPHLFFVRLSFMSFLFITAFSVAAIFTNPLYPKIYGSVFIVFGIILTGYLYILFFGPNLDSAEGVYIQATAQKIVVYSEIVCLLVQSFGAYRIINKG